MSPAKDRTRPGAHMDGVMDESYAQGRERKLSLRYRLQRRGEEIVRHLERHAHLGPGSRMLDVGTADGRMIDVFERLLPGIEVTGVEFSASLATLASQQGHVVVRADACALPVAAGSVDAVVGCAMIEHLRLPLRFIEEARRVLGPGGLLAMTTPSPFWEHVATAVGHLPDEQHHITMDLEALVQMLRGTGLTVLGVEKFMLSPVGMPMERQVEGLIRRLGMDWMLANQIVVARNP